MNYEQLEGILNHNGGHDFTIEIDKEGSQILSIVFFAAGTSFADIDPNKFVRFFNLNEIEVAGRLGPDTTDKILRFAQKNTFSEMIDKGVDIPFSLKEARLIYNALPLRLISDEDETLSNKIRRRIANKFHLINQDDSDEK